MEFREGCSCCFQAEDGIRDLTVTGVQTCALPISIFPSRTNQAYRTQASGPAALDSGKPAQYHQHRPVSPQTEAVWFNALPLLVLAGAYLLVAAALAPTLWRERSRVAASDLAIALVFVSVGVPAAILGAVVLYERAPVGGHVWPLFAATLIALAPAGAFLP